MKIFSEIDAVVEIPRGSRNKYEYDHEKGAIRLDRVLFASVHFPTDYGFIPDTRAPDGDPLDVLIIVEEPTFPGCRVRVRPVGVLLMQDEAGTDEKILAVPTADPRFDGIKSLKDLPRHWLVEIENFFTVYKELEKGKHAVVKGWDGIQKAKMLLKKYAFTIDEGEETYGSKKNGTDHSGRHPQQSGARFPDRGGPAAAHHRKNRAGREGRSEKNTR